VDKRNVKSDKQIYSIALTNILPAELSIYTTHYSQWSSC